VECDLEAAVSNYDALLCAEKLMNSRIQALERHINSCYTHTDTSTYKDELAKLRTHVRHIRELGSRFGGVAPLEPIGTAQP
jgi:hypothetical protein